ncbi:MAG: hypothetical protein NT069_24555 [Planctomycetota bacterium]|nr:hypothetical protein [Planctomycetota bacterium]
MTPLKWRFVIAGGVITLFGAILMSQPPASEPNAFRKGGVLIVMGVVLAVTGLLRRDAESAEVDSRRPRIFDPDDTPSESKRPSTPEK